jgi:TetR/AcrR family transcriptional regulator
MDDIALEAELSKPLIYQHFRTKEDLLFSIALPILERIGARLDEIRERLLSGKYSDGAAVIRDLFDAFFVEYEADPIPFLLISIYDQDVLGPDLHEDTRVALTKQGRFNLGCMREIGRLAMKQGFIKDVPLYQFADVLWGLVSGVIYIVNTKRKKRKEPAYLKSTYELAEQVFLDAFLPK